MIEFLKKTFYYKDGVLYWKNHRRLGGKPAGYTTSKGYIQVRVITDDKKNICLLSHRIIFALHNNYLPDLVDHIDRNPSNNHVDNLRDASKCINAINTNKPLNNTSGFKGVSLHKKTNKWTAQLKFKGRKIHLGLFDNIEDAVKARKKGEEVYFEI